MVNFKQLLDKATSSDLSEPDWETILLIVEEVKTKSVSAKSAIKDLKRRLQDTSGNALYFTVIVTESLMKNCTSDLHTEVLSVDFLTVMKSVITSSKDGRSEKAVDKALELVGEWKSAFGEQTGYKAINTVFSELEKSGYHIPVAAVASAAFIKKPPEWVLSDHCFMCRQEFNRFKGKLRHHCRNCGKSVCATCSSKRTSLAHYAIVEPTRVCDICFKKVEKGEGESAAAAANEMSGDLPVEYLRSSLAQESQTPSASKGSNDEQKMQEDDDLQLAIAMSLNDQENKSGKKSSASSRAQPSATPTPPPQSTTPSAPPPQPQSTLYASIMHNPMPEPTPPPPAAVYNGIPEQVPSDDPLARYLDRNYWEQRKEEQVGGTRGAASHGSGTARTTRPEAAAVVTQQGQNPANLLAESVQNSINMFMKRLHEVSSKGGSIATDPVVLSLYQNLTAMQPQLLKQIDDVQQQKLKQVAVVNKLNEAKEARVTLNKMRRDHQDKVRQMEQEQTMLARMQMEQKLALLRQQKQEQMEFQQNLQQKRLEVLQSQRLEYEQKIAMQRELERKQLIEKEQKVIQHQFGSDVVGTTGMIQPPVSLPPVTSHTSSPQMYRAAQQSGDFQSYQPGQATAMLPPPPVLKPPVMDASSLPMQSLSLQQPSHQQQHQQQQQQAPPLPSKLEYSMPPSADLSGPPPYNPASSVFSLQDPLASSQFPNQPPPPAAHQWTNQVQSQVPPTATGVHQPHMAVSQVPQVNGYTSLAPTSSSHESVQPQFSMGPSPPSTQLQQPPQSMQQQLGYTSVHPSGIMGPPQQQQQQQPLGMPPNYNSDPSHYGQELNSSGSGAMSSSSSQHSQNMHMAPPPSMGLQQSIGPQQQQPQLHPQQQQQQPQLHPQQQQQQPPQIHPQQQPQLHPQQQQPGQFHPQQQQGYGRQESEPPLISFD